MPDENTTATAPSEQPSVPSMVQGPSEQSKAAESSPAPAAETAKPEAPAIDIESIRKQAMEEARERARHEVASEYGKKLSETKRQAEERARLEREQLLSQLSDFVPDSQLAALREQHTARIKAQQQAEEVEQVKARLAAYEQSQQLAELARRATIRAEKAGYNVSDLPPDVRGDSPVGFEERFADFLTEEVAKLKKKVASETKKAAEEAARETERKLGVTQVAGSTPVGSGGGDLASLSKKLRDAHARNDGDAIRELEQAIEQEVYRRR